MTAQRPQAAQDASTPGDPPDAWTRAIFQSVDAMDVGAFTAFMSEDVRFEFVGQPAMIGRPATIAYLQAFFGSLDGITHQLHWQIRHQDTLIVQGQAEYRVGAGTASVSWINVIRIRDGTIAEYRIFVDPAPLQALLTSHHKAR